MSISLSSGRTDDQRPQYSRGKSSRTVNKERNAVVKIQSRERGRKARHEVDNIRICNKVTSREQHAMDLFVEYDQDNNGTLSLKEMSVCLHSMLQSEHIKLPAAQVMEHLTTSFDKHDRDKNNRIGFDEFVLWYNDFIDWVKTQQEGLNTPRIQCAMNNSCFNKGPFVPANKEEEQMLNALIDLDFEKGGVERMLDYKKGSSTHTLKAEDRRPSRRHDPKVMHTKRVADIMSRLTLNFTDAELKHLNESFFKATEVTCEDTYANTGLEYRKKVYSGSTIKDLKSWTKFCRAYGIIDEFFPKRLFDILSGGDRVIHFRELEQKTKVLIKGTQLQRLTFIFTLYDVDGGGQITGREIFRECVGTEKGIIGSTMERDVMSLITLNDTEIDLDEYIEHVKQHGECYLFGKHFEYPSDNQVYSRRKEAGHTSNIG